VEKARSHHAFLRRRSKSQGQPRLFLLSRLLLDLGNASGRSQLQIIETRLAILRRNVLKIRKYAITK